MGIFYQQGSSLTRMCRLGALIILLGATVLGENPDDSNPTTIRRRRRTSAQLNCQELGVYGTPRSDDCEVFISEKGPLVGKGGLFGLCSKPKPGPKPPVGYTGSGCKINGPDPKSDGATVVATFYSIGDTPYDKSATTVDANGNPTFEGDDYSCCKTRILPGMKYRASDADFIVHVGDIKKGDAFAKDPYCSDALFTSRKKLFEYVEPDIDFFLMIGDNEWNECQNFSSTNITDPAKTRWRNYFTTPPFKGFDRSGNLPSGVPKPTVARQTDTPENFFFEYKGIAFIGITEPYGDTLHDPINANWISSNLGNKVYQAIIMFGQAVFSSMVKDALATYYESNGPIPSLYVRGDDHPPEYCMKMNAEFPDSMIEIIVEAYQASPLLISAVRIDEKIFFHAYETNYGCK